MDEVTNRTTPRVEVTSLWKDKVFAMATTWIHNLLRSVIPLLILCVLNYYIILSLRHTKSTRKKLTNRNRITRTLISVIIVFVICITPDTIMTFIGLGYTDANYLARAIREITDLLLTVNSAVNFVLYCIFNKAFRTQFMLLFCKKCSNVDESFFRRASFKSTIRRASSFRRNKTNGGVKKLSRKMSKSDREFLQTLMWKMDTNQNSVLVWGQTGLKGVIMGKPEVKNMLQSQ